MAADPNAKTDEFSMPTPVPGDPLGQPAFYRTQVDVGALSHPGKVRPNNEDFYLVARLERSLQTLLTNLPEGAVPLRYHEMTYAMVVADGVGGAAGGEVASQVAISTLVNLVLYQPDWIARSGEPEAERLLRRIVRRYGQVHATLKEEAREDPKLAGMGTTMTLAFNVGTDLFLGHVGDSRAYFFRGGKLHQITRDHTYAQALADAGFIGPEEVATHHLRHVLTRVLGGGGGAAAADVQRLRLGDGDQVLLCTDGLSDLVEDAAIAAVLRAAATASVACETLVELALERGGKDNVTVVLARYRFAQDT
jgi:protein phosphatase